MSIHLIGGKRVGDDVELSFLTENGVRVVRGSHDEVERLATVLSQTAALAGLADTEQWLDDVRVGDTRLRFGLTGEGQARVLIRHC